MPHTRRHDQSVDAFSLPKDLLKQAKKRAAELKMTKSGFYRYCLAKFLGYPEAAARALAEHRAVLNSVESSIDRYVQGDKHYVVNDEPNSTSASAVAKLSKKAVASAPKPGLK